MSNQLRVTIWNEGRHEQVHEAVQKVYPEGMGNTIAKSFHVPRRDSQRNIDEPLPTVLPAPCACRRRSLSSAAIWRARCLALQHQKDLTLLAFSAKLRPA